MRYQALLADDDANITGGISNILAEHFPGVFDVHCAQSGTELRQLLCAYPAALVISDVKMPGEDGLQCLQFIRDQALNCEVVLLSGYDDYALIHHALKLKAYDYILKPVHIDSFLRLIREILARLDGRQFRTAECGGLRPAAASDVPYFDLPVEHALSAPDLEALLERFAGGMQTMSGAETEQALTAFFQGNDGSVWDREKTKCALVRRMYQLMERIPAMIHIVADSKLTDYDAVSAIKNLPTCSQLQARLLIIVRHYLEELRKTEEKRDLYLIAKVKEHIAAHYMDELTLSQIAGELHMNAHYLSAQFKQWNGSTFREYLRMERISRAQQMIQSGTMKLFEIAERVGYQNASHFNRAFKEVTGVSPSVWALHHRKRG